MGPTHNRFVPHRNQDEDELGGYGTLCEDDTSSEDEGRQDISFFGEGYRGFSKPDATRRRQIRTKGAASKQKRAKDDSVAGKKRVHESIEEHDGDGAATRPKKKGRRAMPQHCRGLNIKPAMNTATKQVSSTPRDHETPHGGLDNGVFRKSTDIPRFKDNTTHSNSNPKSLITETQTSKPYKSKMLTPNNKFGMFSPHSRLALLPVDNSAGEAIDDLLEARANEMMIDGEEYPMPGGFEDAPSESEGISQTGPNVDTSKNMKANEGENNGTANISKKVKKASKTGPMRRSERSKTPVVTRDQFATFDQGKPKGAKGAAKKGVARQNTETETVSETVARDRIPTRGAKGKAAKKSATTEGSERRRSVWIRNWKGELLDRGAACVEIPKEEVDVAEYIRYE